MSGAGGADPSSRILVEEDGQGIVTITINRPEALNALTRPMMQARRWRRPPQLIRSQEALNPFALVTDHDLARTRRSLQDHDQLW